MIALAALAIIVAAVQKWIAGITVQHLGLGTLIVAAAGAVNAGLGWYLVRTGREDRLADSRGQRQARTDR